MTNLEGEFITIFGSLSSKMRDYSLHFVKEYKESTIGGQQPDVQRLEFVVPISRITVCFSVSITTKALLTVKICNANGDGFHLDEYLKKHKMEDINDKLFESRRDLKRSSDYIIDIFNGSLNEIITGKRWEDIPRDWMGYK